MVRQTLSRSACMVGESSEPSRISRPHFSMSPTVEDSAPAAPKYSGLKVL